LTNQSQIIRSEKPQAFRTNKKEAKMNSLHSQQMWDLMREHQAEMLKEAQREHLARMAQKPRASLWNSLFRRQAQSPTLTLETSATPELG
jgi:hypothetical protein